MSETKKQFNYRHIICAVITLGCLCFTFFTFFGAFLRLWESIKDFVNSLGYYFTEIFFIPGVVTPIVNNLPAGEHILPFIADTFEGFKIQWANYWALWISESNFLAYLKYLLLLILNLSKILILVIPLVCVIFVLFEQKIKEKNNDYNKDSKPLVRFKRFTKKYYVPTRSWILSFFEFVKKNKYYYIIWAVIWAFNFNFITIVLEALAYYLYFVASFDLASIYTQIYKLLIDLAAVTNFLPWWAWVILGYCLFDFLRKRIAYLRLEHCERRNRGFINARPIVYMVCGTMGKKKTTAITDMALSQEVMFRQKAFELILKNDLKFPYFPWINLENELKRAMRYHVVYNLATVKKFIYKKKCRYFKAPNAKRLFGYDGERYGFTYDDKLKVVNVWDVIETYAQLYFIYVITSSLLITNYSVRVDSVLNSVGNFPLWKSNFFKTDSRLIDSYSRHSHILDFDTLRLGKKVIEDSKTADSFEFGVVVITEIGKERGNTIELSDKKKNDNTTNQKNDLFNSWLKMIRHSATVDNFPFVRVICDEQRPESWGADARDLCDIVYIKESSDTMLAMPCFNLCELVYSFVMDKFTTLYYKYRYFRGDNSLLVYLIKSLVAKFNDYYTKIYNRFGLIRLDVQIESGTQDGERKENVYFLSTKKIYSKRFSTDCFSDFFTVKALRATVGISDLFEYKTEKATFAELGVQNSYFVNDLLNGLKNNKGK